jgi:ribosome assembly protein RRB1
MDNDDDEDGDGDGDEDKMDEDDEGAEGSDVRAYLPGGELEDGEELEADMSAYDMLHGFNVEWPSLSFDILPDALGNNRTKVGGGDGWIQGWGNPETRV